MPAAFAAFESGLQGDLETIFNEGGDTVTPAQKATDIAGAIRSRLEALVGTYTVDTTVSTTVAPGIPALCPPPSGTGATTGPGSGSGTGVGTVS